MLLCDRAYILSLVVLLLISARLPLAWSVDYASVAQSVLSPKNVSLAPEFPTDAEWVNTDRPIRLQQLRGRLVLLDFWTYGCINCLHILSDLKRLEATFERELVVLGVHTAKYDNESARAHIQQAISRHDITHPVMNDRDQHMWNAYRVSGWPTQILIDPTGRIIQGFIGEHHRERMTRLIRETIAHHRKQGTLREAPPLALAVPEPRDTPELSQQSGG